MRESTVIQGWIDEGKKEGMEKGVEKGRVQTLQHTLRAILKKRFAVVSPEVLQRIDATMDPAVLDRAIMGVLDVARPEDLPW